MDKKITVNSKDFYCPMIDENLSSVPDFYDVTIKNDGSIVLVPKTTTLKEKISLWVKEIKEEMANCGFPYFITKYKNVVVCTVCPIYGPETKIDMYDWACETDVGIAIIPSNIENNESDEIFDLFSSIAFCRAVDECVPDFILREE